MGAEAAAGGAGELGQPPAAGAGAATSCKSRSGRHQLHGGPGAATGCRSWGSHQLQKPGAATGCRSRGDRHRLPIER